MGIWGNTDIDNLKNEMTLLGDIIKEHREEIEDLKKDVRDLKFDSKAHQVNVKSLFRRCEILKDNTEIMLYSEHGYILEKHNTPVKDVVQKLCYMLGVGLKYKRPQEGGVELVDKR